jgi:hypothetical protein
VHRIVKSHLASFVSEFGYESDPESTQFEKFCNFCFLQTKVAGKLDVDDVTTGEGEDGVDGIALLVNERIVQSKDDALLAFGADKRNNDVEIAFVQAKRSEHFDLGDFLKFKDSVLRFLTQTPFTSPSELQGDVREAFDVALDNAPRIRGGQPSLSAVYVATGSYASPAALETARADMVTQIESLGFFARIDVRIFGREALIAAWVESFSGTEATLLMHSHAGLPQLAGIAESYLAVVKAKDFVDQILKGEDGNIRGQLFEDNVRHFLGTENPVNQSIANTINSEHSRSRFPVLNNGVTLVSPDVVVQTNRLFIKNFQIVNGCQTSHVLFANRDYLSDDVMVTLKIVETGDEDVFGELVRATNSQSAIEEPQFLSLSPKARTIEAYFNTFEGEEGRLYFERRDRQYVGKGVPSLRIIDLDAVARAVSAMFLRRPDLSFKYPAQMYEEHAERIFDEANRDVIYYASSLVLYRIHVLTSGSVITNLARKYKWHVLPMVAAMVAGKVVPPLNSKKIEPYCQAIIDVFQVQNDRINEVLTAATDVIMSLGDVSTDRLRRQTTIDELLAKV